MVMLVGSVDFEFIGGDARIKMYKNYEEEFEYTNYFPETEGQEEITKKRNLKIRINYMNIVMKTSLVKNIIIITYTFCI